MLALVILCCCHLQCASALIDTRLMIISSLGDRSIPPQQNPQDPHQTLHCRSTWSNRPNTKRSIHTSIQVHFQHCSNKLAVHATWPRVTASQTLESSSSNPVSITHSNIAGWLTMFMSMFRRGQQTDPRRSFSNHQPKSTSNHLHLTGYSSSNIILCDRPVYVQEKQRYL